MFSDNQKSITTKIAIIILIQVFCITNTIFALAPQSGVQSPVTQEQYMVLLSEKQGITQQLREVIETGREDQRAVQDLRQRLRETERSIKNLRVEKEAVQKTNEEIQRELIETRTERDNAITKREQLQQSLDLVTQERDVVIQGIRDEARQQILYPQEVLLHEQHVLNGYSKERLFSFAQVIDNWYSEIELEKNSFLTPEQAVKAKMLVEMYNSLAELAQAEMGLNTDVTLETSPAIIRDRGNETDRLVQYMLTEIYA